MYATAFGLRSPEAETPAGDQFNPFRVGLDHIALGCEDERELERVAAALQEAGVENTGIKVDETLGKNRLPLKIPTAFPGNIIWLPNTCCSCSLLYTFSKPHVPVIGIGNGIMGF